MMKDTSDKIPHGSWDIPDFLDVTNFDFTWLPDPYDPPYIHVFGTQHQKTGGPRYVVDGATEYKFQSSQIALALPNLEKWKNIENIADDGFDYSWHPDATDPPMTYQFPNHWYDDDGPKYVCDNSLYIKNMPAPVAVCAQRRQHWEFEGDVDSIDFDFSWYPHPSEPPLIHQFGTQWQKTGGPRYVVNGATDVKYHDINKAKKKSIDDKWRKHRDYSFDFTWHPDATDPPYIYQFYDQFSEPGPRYVVTGATDIKHQYDPVATKKPNMSNWYVPENTDVSAFDFYWQPPEHEDKPYIYQFGTQHQRTGGPRYTVPGATDVKYVSSQRAIALSDTCGWRNIDNMEFDFSWHPDDTEKAYIYQFRTQWPQVEGPRYVVRGATATKYMDCITAKVLPMFDNWHIPHNIDDSKFDYTWQPKAISQPYIYQFGTQHQRTGGPRYIVPGATKVKYVDFQRVKTLPDQRNWTFSNNIEVDFDFSWHPDDTEMPYRHIFKTTSVSSSETADITYQMPDAVDNKYHTELTGTFRFKPLDIVFVSNGETGAEERYQRLCEVSNRTIKRVTGVKGRENALRHAAEISETDWFYCFPGKLLVDKDFDFSWHPRLLDEPKHYIFYAKNPVNDLVYGHQAAVCYNRQLVLDTIDYGLDFTMSQLHDIVPVISGIAEYNLDILMTWRTAFREVIKLKADGSAESIDRLNVWLSTAHGDNAEWSLLGAKDGLSYYESVAGEHAALMKSFDWVWLHNHCNDIYGIVQTR